MLGREGEEKVYLTRYSTYGFWFVQLNWPEAVAIRGSSALYENKCLIFEQPVPMPHH